MPLYGDYLNNILRLIDHLVSGCPIVPTREYKDMRRLASIQNRIHSNNMRNILVNHIGTTLNELQKTIRLLCFQMIHIHRLIKYNRSNVVITIYQTYLPINMAVASDKNVYLLKNMLTNITFKTTVITLIIRALCAIKTYRIEQHQHRQQLLFIRDLKKIIVMNSSLHTYALSMEKYINRENAQNHFKNVCKEKHMNLSKNRYQKSPQKIVPNRK